MKKLILIVLIGFTLFALTKLELEIDQESYSREELEEAIYYVKKTFRYVFAKPSANELANQSKKYSEKLEQNLSLILNLFKEKLGHFKGCEDGELFLIKNWSFNRTEFYWQLDAICQFENAEANVEFNIEKSDGSWYFHSLNVSSAVLGDSVIEML
tara:strand:- start:43 stop:510 length:468 start_codon:yes stop_codon:yes gene_type:complete